MTILGAWPLFMVTVTLLLQWQEAREALPDSVRVIEATIDDSWLRDSGPTVSLCHVAYVARLLPVLHSIAFPSGLRDGEFGATTPQ